MSLLTDLISSVALGNSGSSPNSQGGSPIARILTDVIQGHPSGNGLSGLVEQLLASGLQKEVSSWIGSGANQPVSGTQIEQALGSGKIAQLAQQYGLDPAEVSGAIAQVLPHVVDALTPHGQVPANQSSVSSALEGLLGSALGGR